MADYRISVDLSGLAAVQDIINAQVFPLLNQAVRAVAFQTAANWKQAVMEAKLWSGEKDAYVKSITWKMTGDLSAVVESDYRHAEEIESGRPARDLKKMLGTSLKVRRTMDGRRFLVIPFRHNIPGSASASQSMPDHVYAHAKAMTASIIAGQSQRRSGEIVSARIGRGMTPLGEKRQRRNPFLSDPATKGPMMVNKNIYQWGGRLPAGMMGPNPKGKTDRFAGMVRFDTSSGKAKSSAYLTFRVMMEGSSGWIVPPQPGLFLAKKVTEDMQPLAENAFAEAIKRTLGG